MNKQQTSAIFALHFLQEMKGETEITGAYDPEQQLWIPEGPVQANWFPTRTREYTQTTRTVNRSTGNGRDKMTSRVPVYDDPVIVD